MTTPKWSYIPFFSSEPTRDPREPPVPPDYEHLVGLNPQKVAVLVSIYEGKARIHLAAPEDQAEPIANAYADAYAGSSLGEPTESSPFYRSAVEEVTHVLFRTTQNHDMPVRVYMRGPKGHSGWWSDPLPNGRDVEFRDVSSHLFDGVTAFFHLAPRARIYLQFICERVGPMEEKTTVRSILGTPHKDRIRYLAEGKVWTAADGWHVPTQPTSTTSAQYKGGVVSRPMPSPGQSDFRDIFTRRVASHDFYRTEIRAVIVTPIGDSTSVSRALELLNAWRKQARFLGVDMADYDLWTLEVLRAPALKGKDSKEEWYHGLDRAVEELTFYPHGGNPVSKRDLTLRECLVLQPLPWEKRHKCLSYQPAVASTTQVLPKELAGSGTILDGQSSGLSRTNGQAQVGAPVHSNELPATSESTVIAAPQGNLVRVGYNRMDRAPVWLPPMTIHGHVFGKSGSGKTTLFLNGILGTFRAWRTVPDTIDIVISSHGDIFRDLKDRLTVEEAQHVIEIDPANMVRDGRVAIGMNPLRIEGRERLSSQDLIETQYTIRGDVSQIVSAKMGSREMGERIRRNFGMVVGGMLDIQELETTLYDVYLVLEGKGKTRERSEFARRVRNDDIRRYVEESLPNLDLNILQSSQNKATNFAHPNFRAALCQRGEGVVTMHRLMLENKLILVNLQQEKLTKEVAEYMGSVYLTMIWLAALRQGGEGSHRIIRLWVDEWPDIASESFASILRAGRKYGLRLWLATQAVGNIPNGKDGSLDLLPQVTGNVNTWVTFQTDEDTAKLVNQYARLERFGFDFRHYLSWPEFYAGVAHGNQYADMVIDPKPAAQPAEVRAEVEEIVRRNTWRYAKSDNSSQSPFKIGKETELVVLEAFARHGTMTQDQAILHVPQHRSIVWIVCDNLERYHFLVKHKDAGKKYRYQITALGRQELAKYGKAPAVDPDGTGMKMQGGDSHNSTLERARAYLLADGLQVGPQIIQEVGKSAPDFTHTLKDGTLVNDEVEDRASHPDRVLKNYEKNPGRPKWFWAVDLDTARLIVKKLGERPGYLVYVDQGGSFSPFGPGVPKEDVPISEEQDLVELSIVTLIKEGKFANSEGRRGFSFKDIVRSLPKPLAYQKVRSVLDRMVGDTVYAIRERRPEQGGPLVILNDVPENEHPSDASVDPKSTEATRSEEAAPSDGDVEMVFDTCVALSNTGKTFVHNERGARVSLRFSDVYEALPKRISLARFKEVVRTLLQQDDLSEIVLRPNDTAILVVDPPETGIVDNKMALEATPEELFRGLLPAAIAMEKGVPRETSPKHTTANSETSPVQPPPGPGRVVGLSGPSPTSPKEGVWELCLRTARDKWQKRQKSFLTEDGKHVGVKFDTLYGMVKTALVRGGQGSNLNPNLLVQTLKEHGVEVESRAPPPHWTQAWHERFCLFPLGMVQDASRSLASPSTGSAGAPTPHQASGRELMVQNLVANANSLLAQGKALPVEGKKAVRVSDLCAFYPPWNETQMGQYLKLLDIPTSRPWIQAEKGKVTVWFAWG